MYKYADGEQLIFNCLRTSLWWADLGWQPGAHQGQSTALYSFFNLKYSIITAIEERLASKHTSKQIYENRINF